MTTTTTTTIGTLGTLGSGATTLDPSSLKAMALPGYQRLDYAQDLDIHTFGSGSEDRIGRGGTAAILKGRLKNSDFLRRNDGQATVAVKHFLISGGHSKSKGNSNGHSTTACGTLDEANEEALLAFKFEVVLLSVLQGKPNIVKLVGYTERPNTIVMRMYKMSLHELLFPKTSKPLDPPSSSVPSSAPSDNRKVKTLLDPLNALQIARDVARGLRSLHAIDIVHFDLKPQNILLDEAGVSHITDFGYAAVGRRGGLVRGIEKPRIAGITAAYCSPELFSRVSRCKFHTPPSDTHFSAVPARPRIHLGV